MTDHSRLFEAFLAGNDAAFAELYRYLNPRLSAYCHKLSRDNAEDLMQELWERVIAMRSPAGRKRKLEVVNPSAFLFRMLKNLTIDHYRGSQALLGTAVSIDEAEMPETTMHDSHGSDIETIVIDALEQLPPDDRELLVLNIYSGYSFGEIGEMVGKSTDAIWKQASRARMKLRTIVIEEAKRTGIALPPMNKSSANTTEKIEAKV